MRPIPALLSILLAACGAGPAAAPPQSVASQATEQPELAKDFPWMIQANEPTRAFTGPTGILFELVPLESTVDTQLTDRALLRITGTRDKINGVVFLVRRNSAGHSRLGFGAVVGGQPRPLLSEDGRGGWEHYPDAALQPSIKLTPVTDAEVDAKGLLQQHLAQRKSGLLEKIAPEDRQRRQSMQEKVFLHAFEEAQQACGGLEPVIDWSGVEDSWFEEQYFGYGCAEVAALLVEFCSGYPEQQAQVREMGKVTCSLATIKKAEANEISIGDTSQGLVYSPSDSANFFEPNFLRLRHFFGPKTTILRGAKKQFLLKLEDTHDALYLDDGTAFYKNGHYDAAARNGSVQLDRAGPFSFLVRSGSSWILRCPGGEEPLTVLPDDQAAPIIASAKLIEHPKWTREPYYLARDDRGVYYYVDKSTEKEGGKRYRVFVGRRGQMKLSTLKGLVEDSEGTIFSTDKGELRLIVSAQTDTGVWIRGRKQIPLTTVDTYKNRTLIYDELGVYVGEDFGFACQ